MAFLSITISVALLVYLALRISKMVGGDTAIASRQAIGGLPELPNCSDADIELLLASMPTAWTTYQGMTPPLELKVRGLSHELYRRFTKLHLDAYGRHILDTLTPSEVMEVGQSLLPNINAAAYVVDWKGAAYQNGNPIPYSPENLASFMRKDEMLRNFVSEEAGKIGPAW